MAPEVHCQWQPAGGALPVVPAHTEGAPCSRLVSAWVCTFVHLMGTSKFLVTPGALLWLGLSPRRPKRPKGNALQTLPSG